MKEITRRVTAVPAWKPGRPGWWVLALALVTGLVLCSLWLGPAFARFPIAGAVGVALSVPYVVLVWWLMGVMQIGTRLARSGAVTAILWGGLVATAVYAAEANGAIITLLAQHGGLDLANEWGAAIAAPLTEETGKALGIAAVLIAARSWLRGPMDGLIMGAFVGMGFTVTENVLYAFNTAVLTFEENQAVSTIAIYLLRAVLLWPVDHVAFTALAGAGLGFLLGRPGSRSVQWGVLSLVLAYGLHFLWNSPLLPGVLARMGFASLIPFIVWFVVHRARRAEHAWLTGALAHEVEVGAVPSVHVEALAPTLRRRLKHRRAVARAYGPPARTAQRKLEGLMVGIADAVDAGDTAERDRLRAQLDEQLNAPISAV